MHRIEYHNCLVRVRFSVITIFPEFATLEQAMKSTGTGFKSGAYAEKCTIVCYDGAYIRISNIQSGKDITNFTYPHDISILDDKIGVVWSLCKFNHTQKVSRFGKVTYKTTVESLVEHSFFNADSIYFPTNQYRIDIKER